MKCVKGLISSSKAFHCVPFYLVLFSQVSSCCITSFMLCQSSKIFEVYLIFFICVLHIII